MIRLHQAIKQLWSSGSNGHPFLIRKLPVFKLASRRCGTICSSTVILSRCCCSLWNFCFKFCKLNCNKFIEGHSGLSRLTINFFFCWLRPIIHLPHIIIRHCTYIYDTNRAMTQNDDKHKPFTPTCTRTTSMLH